MPETFSPWDLQTEAGRSMRRAENQGEGEDERKLIENKGVRRMPWLSEAKKDVISCEKPRGGGK
jgi:hypothetical protein